MPASYLKIHQFVSKLVLEWNIFYLKKEKKETSQRSICEIRSASWLLFICSLFVPFHGRCSLSFSFLLLFLQQFCLSSAGLMKFDGDRACNYRLSRADACLALNSLTGEFVIIRKRGGWFNLFSLSLNFSFLFLFSLSLSLYAFSSQALNFTIRARERIRDFFCSSFKFLWIRDICFGFFESLRKSLGGLVKLWINSTARQVVFVDETIIGEGSGNVPPDKRNHSIKKIQKIDCTEYRFGPKIYPVIKISHQFYHLTFNIQAFNSKNITSTWNCISSNPKISEYHLCPKISSIWNSY